MYIYRSIDPQGQHEENWKGDSSCLSSIQFPYLHLVCRTCTLLFYGIATLITHTLLSPLNFSLSLSLSLSALFPSTHPQITHTHSSLLSPPRSRIKKAPSHNRMPHSQTSPLPTVSTQTLHIPFSARISSFHSTLFDSFLPYCVPSSCLPFFFFSAAPPRSSKSSNTERRLIQNPATQRDDLLKIQQHRETTYSKSSNTERRLIQNPASKSGGAKLGFWVERVMEFVATRFTVASMVMILGVVLPLAYFAMRSRAKLGTSGASAVRQRLV